MSTLEKLQDRDSSLIDSMSAFTNALQRKDAVLINHIFIQSRQHLAFLYLAADKDLLAYVIDTLSGFITQGDILFHFALDLLKNNFADIFFELLCLIELSTEQMGQLLQNAFRDKKKNFSLMILADMRWDPACVENFNLLSVAISHATIGDNQVLKELLKRDFLLCKHDNGALHLALLKQNRWLCLRLMQDRAVLHTMGFVPYLPVFLVPEVAICTDRAPKRKKTRLQAQLHLLRECAVEIALGTNVIGLPDLLLQEMCKKTLEPFSNCVSEYAFGTLLSRINVIFRNVDATKECMSDGSIKLCH